MGGDRLEEGRHPHGKKVGTEMNEVKREVLNGMEEQRKVGLQECRHLQVVAEPEDLNLWGCWTLSGLGWKYLVGGVRPAPSHWVLREGREASIMHRQCRVGQKARLGALWLCAE